MASVNDVIAKLDAAYVALGTLLDEAEAILRGRLSETRTLVCQNTAAAKRETAVRVLAQRTSAA